MNIKRSYYIIVAYLLLLTTCSKRNTFTIEGNITGLANPIIHIETAIGQETRRDTVLSKEGEFYFTASSKMLQPAIIYMEDDSVWITVWVKNGETIRIFGDVSCPELIAFTGNETNNLLTGFRQNLSTIIRKRYDSYIQERNTEIDQMIIRKSLDFIRKHPTTIASLVLIQDYLVQSGDPVIVSEALTLIKSPARENILYIRLEEVCRQMQMK